MGLFAVWPLRSCNGAVQTLQVDNFGPCSYTIKATVAAKWDERVSLSDQPGPDVTISEFDKIWYIY